MMDSDLFSEHFAFGLPAVVNFVGGGGKTGLILRLLAEYSESIPVVYTTTTRIHPPHPSDGLIIISSDNESLLGMLLRRAANSWNSGRKFVATRLPGGPNLLRGVDRGFSQYLDRTTLPLILNEADGARSMSLKMPRAGEPVLMNGAEYLVPVIGLDCLGQPLGPESLFRWELVSGKLEWKLGDILDPEIAAGILLHPDGVCRDWVPGMEIIPYINKVDSQADDHAAHSLAEALLRNRNFPVKRVVMGSVQNTRATCLVG